MPDFVILYDDLQESRWFRSLHSSLAMAKEVSITEAKDWPGVRNVLLHDRPDIVLLDDDKPILVIEETVEVPSGHNVGQRFGRVAAAAEAGVPCLYFGPYVAMKHGGATSGRRYVNARLFHAVDALARVTGTAVTTINWPVDSSYEVLRGHAKDADVREYIETFLNIYEAERDLGGLNVSLMGSDIHRRMVKERNQFVATIPDHQQYASPPPSVEIYGPRKFMSLAGSVGGPLAVKSEFVVYRIEVQKMRADPYVGAAMMYKYLYVAERNSRGLVLHFPHINEVEWRQLNRKRKEVRMFPVAADAILFADALVERAYL